MQIAKSIHVDAPVETVWRILAEEYADVGQWARAVQSSAPNPDAAPLTGASVGGRVCTASIGEVAETIREYDAANYQLAYEAHSKSMPFFVRGLHRRWKLNPLGGTTEVDLAFEADLMAPFGFLMGWMMRRQFETAINDTLADLKLYAETGKIHPDKAKALAA
ncbi:SRPBCC family protein [Jannaschia sp. CCS1]|uniref:SRPBCC family protein n=1 Tax=Jannaschia sp. (strain CCS1) TaxID=290400 RepID=UPI000053AA40|nr:SRPBCC family protein [Jannaschia sp. CCS1]ABD55545.1 hypothetical protein Jann_2628 [Jannaschia sp. CCS1]